MNRKLIEKEELAETLLPKFQFKSGEYYMQCARTKHFLALRREHLQLDDTQNRIPTYTGLIKLVHQDGSIALHSSLNGEQLKVDNAGDIVTVSQEAKEAGKELEDFEFFQTEGNENDQLIIRSIQAKKFVRVSKLKTLCADVIHPSEASKFVLKDRYLLQIRHYQINFRLRCGVLTKLFVIVK